MAPSRNNKRAAVSAPADEPAAKKVAATLKKNGVTQGSYKQMAEALAHPMAGYLPEECRKMLLAMLPQSLCVASDLRQEVQSLAVTMISEVMSTITAKLEEVLEAENGKIADAETAKAELDEKVEAAEAALKDAQAAHADRDSDLQASSEAVLAAKGDLAKREEEQKIGDAALVAAQASKEELETAASGDFQTLRNGEWEEGQAKAHFQTLEPLLAKLAMDESLKTAMQSVLLKKPAQRGPFDSTIIDELDKCFQGKIAELTQILDNGKPDSDVRAAAVADARAVLEAAETKQKECSSELLAAKEAQKEAAAGVLAAKEAVTENKPVFKAATEVRDQKQEELKTFQDTSVSGFQQLQDRLSAKKLKQIAAAEAAAKAEAEAAAQAEAEAKAAAEAEAKAAAEAEAAAAAAAAAAAEETTPMEAEAAPAEEPAPMETEAASVEAEAAPAEAEAALAGAEIAPVEA